MAPDHDRLETILVNALEIESECDREHYILQACNGDATLKRQIDRLIWNHQQADSFPCFADPIDLSKGVVLDEAIAQIGPYRLLQKIGEGGMGLIFLAEQDKPFLRQVAVKVIRTGMDSNQVVARFEQERQALAVMDHANIARVIDGGLTADGRPYFAMELIQGHPITDYCDRNQLTLRQRLELFVPVCSAIQHAHQKGIIHRDLKPSNVLVTETEGTPIPKVIDFGVAKAIGARLSSESLHTHLGAVIGTLEYMSPEQAVPDGEDIDTRSDIYCLGVLLFELLTGSTPLQPQKMKDKPVLELLRCIREDESPSPSNRLSTAEDLIEVATSRNAHPKTLGHVVKGDLDWIVMKCLEKDRNRRYSSAVGVAHDIERYLADEPVEAGPPGTTYRLRKFLWRHRWAAVAGSLLMLILIGGVVGTSIGMVQAAQGQAAADQALTVAQQQRDRAERNYQRAMAAVDRLLTRVGGVRLESTPHMDDTRRKLLEDAVEFYREMLQDESHDPIIRREVGLAWQRVGDIQGQLGDPQAEKSLNRAIEIQQLLLHEFPQEPKYQTDCLRSYRHLAFELFRAGRLPEAERIVDDRLKLNRFPTNASRYEHALLHFLRGLLYGSTQKIDEAIAACKESMRVVDELVDREPPLMIYRLARARVLNSLGNFYREERRLEESETCLQEAKKELERMQTSAPGEIETQDSLACVCNNLGLTYANLDRRTDAMTVNETATSILTQLARDHPGLPDYKWRLAKNFNNSALLYASDGDPAQAAVENEKALSIYTELMQSYPARIEFIVSYLGGCGNQGKYLSEQGLWEESLVWNSKAIEAGERFLTIEPRHTEVRRMLHNCLMGRAGSYRRFQKLELAIADYRRSLELSQGERHANYVNFRPRALAYVGDYKQAAAEVEAIVSNRSATGANFSEMASVYSICVASIERDAALAASDRRELLERYAVRAVELIGRAAQKGRYPKLEHLDELRTDERLRPIQDRVDFQQLISSLEQSLNSQE